MGFLSIEEFQQRVPANLAALITKNVGSYDQAERDVATQIATITGATIPDDPVDAPAWTKGPAAHLILFNLVGNVESLSAERLSWARELRAAALAELERHRVSATGDSIEAQIGDIEGLFSYNENGGRSA